MFKTTKAKVIFVTVFSLVCIIITALLILYQNIDIEEVKVGESNSTVNEEKEKDIPGIDLNGTYNQNDVRIEEKSVSSDKVEIQYYQISGLKDKTIEEKINKDIEHFALNFYKEEIKDLNEVINISVGMWNSANFANTISFSYYHTAKKDDNGDGFYQTYKGLNYDLTTGEKITIDKVFTSDAPIENILRQSAYYSLIQNKVEDNLTGDFVVNNYGDIEDEIYSIINLYKKGKLTEFYFSPSHINICYNDYTYINISMEKYAEYIAIYNRYLTEESIYESTDIGLKNLYTLADKYGSSDYYRYTIYEKGQNYFIDINIDNYSGAEDEFSQKLKQDKIKKIKAEVEKLKSSASNNPNEFYVLNYYMYAYIGEERTTQQELVHWYEYGNFYDMTVHDFEENVEPIIRDYNRQEPSGELPRYVYDFSYVLKIEPQETIEYYNPQTEEKIVI